jgi:hypothetical protein
MWSHAEALIGIPEAIKATIDIFDYVRSGRSSPENGGKDGIRKLADVRGALEGFATDAVELAAYKQLHMITNSFMIDLKEAFAIAGPDEKRARLHHSEMLDVIQIEFISVWEGQRAGAQLAKLRDTPKHMGYLSSLPKDVMERIPVPPWDEYYWKLLRRTQDECGNFNNFSKCISEFRVITVALNNLADRNISREIEEFNSIMEKLRTSLGRAR